MKRDELPYTKKTWDNAIMAAINAMRPTSTRPYSEMSHGLQRIYRAEAHKVVLAVALVLHAAHEQSVTSDLTLS